MKSKRKPLITIGIINYFSVTQLNGCLASLCKYHPDALKYQYIIVNNSPGDYDQIENVYKNFIKKGLDICLVHNKQNNYFAPAYNQIIPLISAAYFCFLNPDIYFVEDSLTPLREFLRKNPDYDLVGGRMIKPRGDIYKTGTLIKDPFSELYAYLPGKKFFNRLYERKLRDIYYKTWDRLSDKDVESLSNAFCMIRSDSFRSVGGFNPKLRLWYTEDDLGIKLRLRGKKSRFYSSAQVIHEEGVSVGNLFQLKYYCLITCDQFYFYRSTGKSRLNCIWYALLFILLRGRLILIGAVR